MHGRKPRCQTRDHGHRGRNDAETQRTRNPASEAGEIDPQPVIVVENPLGPGEHPIAFGGEAQKPVAANDQPDFEIILQLADRCRKSWLGNVARLRRPREMLFARERDEIAEVAKKHQR